jgi:CheY-like chemotaxis protein/HPt (histidine-containing phosphotransfer) domain-containing protein
VAFGGYPLLSVGVLAGTIRIQVLRERKFSMKGESSGEIDLEHSSEEEVRMRSILLVEDYPANQMIATEHLENAGYHVDLAEDGKQAINALKCKHYGLILMDIQMPVMDGYQATKAIRELESKLAAMNKINADETMRRVPIIAMTGHTMSENKTICLEAGMDDFLSKPYTREGLLSMVSKWLELSAKLVIQPSAPNPNVETSQDIVQIAVHADNPIDIGKAIEEFEGDKQFLFEVIDGFTMEVIEQIVTIRKALSCGDAETVRNEAHSIKGGAANITAKALSRVAFELEIKGKIKELNGAGEIVDNLEREFETLRKFIQENF